MMNIVKIKLKAEILMMLSWKNCRRLKPTVTESDTALYSDPKSRQ